MRFIAHYMFRRVFLFLAIVLLIFTATSGYMVPDLRAAEDLEYERIRMSFVNFTRCELTRTGATSPFNGKPFEITEVNLFDAVHEGDFLIVTGSVDCFVDGRHEQLYAAVGVKILLGREKASFFVIRKEDFTILATELMKYPYKERCGWTQYWVDVN